MTVGGSLAPPPYAFLLPPIPVLLERYCFDSCFFFFWRGTGA